MKHVVIVPGGAADRPAAALYGKTPLQAARLPTLDSLARDGLVGMVDLIPPDMPPTPEIAAMALLGYDPERYFTGPGPLDAAGREIPLDPRDAVFRVDLATSDGEVLTHPTAGGIAGEDAETLLRDTAARLSSGPMRLFPVRGRRGVLVWNGGPADLRCFPPGAAAGKPLPEVLPEGDGDAMLRMLIYDSLEILDGHEVNERRRDEGKPPANILWPWGPGRVPHLPSFTVRRGMGGVVVSPSAYFRGLGLLAGLRAPVLPGATGRIDTDYEGKVRAAAEALQEMNFALIHLGAPGVASAQGDAEMKQDALVRIDDRVVAPLLKALKPLDDFRILVVPDIALPVEERAPARDPVPFLLYASRGLPRGPRAPFDESAVEESKLRIDAGYRLLDELLKE